MRKASHTLVSQRSANGYALLSVVGALSIIALTLPAVLSTYNNISKGLDQTLVADQVKIISRAAREYTRANFSTLATATSPTVSKKVTVPQLINANFLPEGFAERNLWGQNYEVWIAQPNDGNLQPLVITSGGDKQPPEFGKLEIPQTARRMGAMGGFIPAFSTEGMINQQTAQGVAGGWTINLAAYGIPSPGPGHLVALAEFTSVEDPSAYLHRKKVIGRPELNRMETNLSMSDNDIESVGRLSASSVHADTVDLSDGQIARAGAIQFESHEKADFSCSANPEENGRLFLVDDEGLFICRKGDLTRVHDDANFTGVPVGAILPWPNATPPEGFLECNGLAFSASEYPELQAVLGTNTLPDLRGEFLRGWDHGKGVDPARTLRSKQGEMVKIPPLNNAYVATHANGWPNEPRDTTSHWGYLTHGVKISDCGGHETRPRNYSVMYIIKAA